MNLNFRWPFIIFILLLGAVACNSTNNKTGKVKGISLKNQLKTPDSSSFKKIANFLSDKEKDSIINEETKLRNGKKRSVGIKPLPQDGDDFRNAMLDNVYWNGVHVVDGDFRGASMRSAKCNETNFSYSDFRAAISGGRFSTVPC